MDAPWWLVAICGFVAIGFGLLDVYLIRKGEYDDVDKDAGKW